MAGIDLNSVKQIVIEVSRGPAGWHWIAVVDGKQAGAGDGQDPDEAVDAAEQLLWPDKEAEEHGEGAEPGEGTPAEEGAEGEEQEGQEADQGGAVPTAQSLWNSEAKKRQARNAAVNSIS